MVTIAQVLEVNWVILYFAYGQAFFIMGLVTGLQLRRASHLELARALPWLAAFGIAHGLTEWGYIFVPAQALYLEDVAVRLLMLFHLLLLGMSFLFLFQFGVELLLPFQPHRRWLRIVPGALLLFWGGALLLRRASSGDPLNVMLAIGDGWSRYLMCFPGAILAFLGLRRQSRQVREMGLPRIAAYLIAAAIAFLVYAVVGGLVVPTAPVFPANVLNYALLDRTIHLPVAVFRSLCGLAMAVFVVRSLDVFRADTERRMAQMEEAQALTVDRERIGRELHDGIIQNIYAAGLSLERMERQVDGEPQRAEQVGSVLAILNRTIQDIRNYVFDLRAAEEPHELEVVLGDLVRDLRLDTMLEVDLNVTGQRCWQMSHQEVAHLTQIAREALSNVVRHAHAQHVTIDLAYTPGSVGLAIADDGLGIDPEALRDVRGLGHGIANIQERARQLGGELALRSEPNRGLQLLVTVPCPNNGA